LNQRPIFCAGTTPAIHFAREFLSHHITVCEAPCWDCGHLLLDIPTFRPGSIFNLDTLINSLPPDIVIWGGGLEHLCLNNRKAIDLLQNEAYLTANAEITAHCAIHIAEPMMTDGFQNCPVLITGWGRIGKFLAGLLRDLGADVYVAARKQTDREILTQTGYTSLDYSELASILPNIRLIFNTVPELVLPDAVISHCHNCIKIDLASKKGIAGPDVIWARGLPGIHAPERSGTLIGKTILHLMSEVTS